MKKHFAGLLCLSTLSVMPLTAGLVRIYVPNNAGTTVVGIDPATNKVVQEIKDVEAPESVHFSRDGSRIYIASGGEDVLYVVDRKTGNHIKKVMLSGHPNDSTVTPDGKFVLVCIQKKPGALDVIDTTTLERVKSLRAKDWLHDVAVTRDSHYAVVGSPGGKFADVFDLRTGELAWEINFEEGVLPIAIESNPDGSGRRIFLQMFEFNGVVVIDFATHKEVARLNFPEKPDFGRTESHGIGISPDGKTLWANSMRSNSVYTYSLPDLKFLGAVFLPVLQLPGHGAIGSAPNWLCFTPDSKTVYVSLPALQAVSAIDVKSRKIIVTIPTAGEEPKRVATLVAQ